MQELTERGIALKNFAVGDHKSICPECSHTRRNKTDQCLSITIEPDGGAVWKCHHCDWSGGVAGRSYRSDQEGYSAIKVKAPEKRPTPVPPLPKTSLLEQHYEWFGKRGISRETVDAFGIIRTQKFFGNGEKGCIGFPYFENGEVVNVKYRTSTKDFRQEKNAKKTLFNIDRLREEKTIIFVEGEMDVIACFEAGFPNAVSLPDGAPKEAKFEEGDKRFSAISNCADALDGKEQVIIAVDNDDAGNALKLELAHRFGKDRCSVVSWPSYNGKQLKDANEVLLAFGHDILIDCINAAEPFPVEGVYSVKDYRREVFDIYTGNIQRPVDTGFPNLDEFYQVMSGTFALVTGIPNHGKSNFLDHLAVNLMKRHDWKFAVFSPEHSTPNHIRRLAEKIIEKPFDVGPNIRMSKDELGRAMDALDQYFFFMESEDEIPSIDWLLAKCKSAVLRFGCRGIIIDPYNEIDATRSGAKREDEHIRDLISKCKSFCRSHNVAMWMVAHPAKMRRDETGAYPPPSLYDVSGSAHWNNMADVGLVVHRDFEEGQTRVITRKIREQGLYGSIGEAFFSYNLSKHIYEPVAETPLHSESYQNHWTQD